VTTENGLPRTREVRAAITTLTNRRDWVLRKIEDRLAARPAWGVEGSHEWDEVRALNLAIEVLEAEFDFVARLQRQVRHWEGRALAEERRAEVRARKSSSSGAGTPKVEA
jgi:hypothetical protein